MKAEVVDVIPELRAHIARKYVKQARAAEAWGVSGPYVSKVLNGNAPPTKVMLDDAGIERRPAVYVRKPKTKEQA